MIKQKKKKRSYPVPNGDGLRESICKLANPPFSRGDGKMKAASNQRSEFFTQRNSFHSERFEDPYYHMELPDIPSAFTVLPAAPVTALRTKVITKHLPLLSTATHLLPSPVNATLPDCGSKSRSSLFPGGNPVRLLSPSNHNSGATQTFPCFPNTAAASPEGLTAACNMRGGRSASGRWLAVPERAEAYIASVKTPAAARPSSGLRFVLAGRVLTRRCCASGRSETDVRVSPDV